MSKTVNAKRVEFNLGNEDYRMDKYKSKTVLVFKKVDGVYDFVSARNVIRLKLNEVDPANNSLKQTKTENTRSLGARLYKLLTK